jgi:response regulator RpfG family c-di-GMP phosphodiesterase
MAKLKFLVVEDEPEILEFNSIMLMSAFDCDITSARNGNEAVQILKKSEHASFDCIVSDYNMFGGNADIIHRYVVEHLPETPFLLATAGFFSDHKAMLNRSMDGYVQKPFDGDKLIQAVKKVLKSSSEDLQSPEYDYVPVSYMILSKFSKSPGDIFVQINPLKFTRILKKDDTLVYNDLLKYEAKGAHCLYVEKKNWRSFVMRFLDSVDSIMNLEKYRHEPAEVVNFCGHVQEVLQATIRNFGWTPEAQETAHRNVQIVRKIIENQAALKQFESIFSGPERSQSLLHSILLSYIINISYAENSAVNKPRDMEYLTLAAMIHDTTLDEHLIRNETSLVKSVILNIGANKKDRLEVQEHPEKLYRILQTWPGSNEDFLQTLIQHHETFDGKGFPAKLDVSKIGRLAQAFIIAHELTELYLQSRDLVKTQTEFLKRGEVLSKSPFNFYQDCQKLLERALK